ncbi:PIN domain protein, partial [hydrothermal vent metagenome]
MINTLIDAGPLIALFDRSDKYHLKAVRYIKELEGQLLTTWPVITEVCHLLDFNTTAQINFLTWVE